MYQQSYMSKEMDIAASHSSSYLTEPTGSKYDKVLWAFIVLRARILESTCHPWLLNPNFRR